VLTNNLIASASVEPVKRVGASFFIAPSFNKLAKFQLVESPPRNDSGWLKLIVKHPSFPQKLWRKNNVLTI
jgi:hypothetical protein